MNPRGVKRQLFQLPIGSAMNTLSYSEISPPPTNQHAGSYHDDLEFRTAQLNALIASGSSPAIDFLERITQPNSPTKSGPPLDIRHNNTQSKRPLPEMAVPRRSHLAERSVADLQTLESPRIAEIRQRYGLPPRQRRSLTVRRSSIGRALEQERLESHHLEAQTQSLMGSSHRIYAPLDTSDRSHSHLSSRRYVRESSKQHDVVDKLLKPQPRGDENKLVTQRWEFDPKSHRIYYHQDRNIARSMVNHNTGTKTLPQRAESSAHLSLPTEALNAALQQVLGNLGIPVIAKITVIEKETRKSHEDSRAQRAQPPSRGFGTPSRTVNRLPIQAMTPSTKSPQKGNSSPMKAVDSHRRHRTHVNDENRDDRNRVHKETAKPDRDTGQKQLRQQLRAINVEPNTKLFRSPPKTQSGSTNTLKLQSDAASGNTDHRALKELRRALQSTMSEEDNFYIKADPETFRQLPHRRAAVNLFGEAGMFGTQLSTFGNTRDESDPRVGRGQQDHTDRECPMHKRESPRDRSKQVGRQSAQQIQNSRRTDERLSSRSPWKDLARTAPGGRSIRYLGRHH